jgi:ABC-type spermidine/putrescine transport system permease subunit II
MRQWNNISGFAIMLLMGIAVQMHEKKMIADWLYSFYMWFIGPMLLLPFCAIFVLSIESWRERFEVVISGLVGYWIGYLLFFGI